MMTRAEANELIKSALNADQLDEFDYQINVVKDTIDYETEQFGDSDAELPDYVDVLVDLADRASQAAFHDTDPQCRKEARAARKIYDRLLLQIGYYRPATPHEIENTYEGTSRGMRKHKFASIDGVRVTQDKSFSVFLEELV